MTYARAFGALAVSTVTVLALILVFYFLISVPFASWQRCQAAGTAAGVATSWSPIDGCTATILGTKVRV